MVTTNKRIAKNTALLYFRTLFTLAVSLYTSRMVLSILGVMDYGIYNVVGGVVTMLNFLNGAMSSSTVRYLTFEQGRGNMEQLRKLFGMSFMIHAFIATLVALLAETLGIWFINTHLQIPDSRMDAVWWVYHCSVISACLSMLMIPYTSVIIARERFTIFAYIGIINVLFRLGVVMLLAYLPFDKLKVYAFLLLCVQLIAQLLQMLYCHRQFSEIYLSPVRDKKLFSEMSSFAGWSMVGELSLIAYTQGLNMLLNMFFGPLINAARGVAVQVQTAVNSLSINFQAAVNPQITKSYAVNDLQQMHRLIYVSSKYSFFLLFLLSFPIMLETQRLLECWLVAVPNHTVNFVRLMLCIIIMDGMANPLIMSAKATGKIKNYQLVVGTLALMTVPLSYLALKMNMPPESVFVVHLMMTVFSQIARLWIIRPMVLLSLRTYFNEVIGKIIKVVILPFLFVTLCYCFFNPGKSGELFICIVAELIAFVSVYFLGLGNVEKEFVNKQVVNFFKNKRR